MMTQNRPSMAQEIDVKSARSGSAPPAALSSSARSNTRPTFLSGTAMQISRAPGLGLGDSASFIEPGLVSRGLSEDFKITERVEDERSKDSRPASTSLGLAGDSHSSPLPGSAQSSDSTVPALHPTLSADLPSVQLAKSLSPNNAGKTAVPSRLSNRTDAHPATPLQQDNNGRPLPANGVLTGATGGTTSSADMMGLVTRALAEGMNLNNVLEGLTAPTKPGSSSQDEAAEPGQPGWHWPVADPRSSGPADHPTWGGMWTGPDTAQQFSPASNSSGQKASGFAAAASYLSQDQLLPACLLLSSRNTPSPKHSTAWATNQSHFSPTQNSSASQLAPAGESGTISHPSSSNGLSVDGGNASAAISGEAAATLSTTNVDILSTALEKLRPDELELLASMEPSQFQSLMFSAVASLAGPQDGAASGAAAPPVPHPEAGMAAAGSSPGSLTMQQLQAMLQLGGGSQQGAAGVRLLQQQQQLLQAQQQAKVPLQPPVTAGQLQALFQMFPPLPQQENVVSSPLTNGYRPALVSASPFAVGMHPMYQLGLQSPPGAHPPPPPPRSHLAGATEGEGSWEELTQTVRDKVQSMVMRCEPHIKLSHFDGGVRHWLAQLTSLFGENAALSGLATIEQATNLAGVRNMRAFITTRLIDCFEQHIFQRDPAGYAARRLLPEQYQLLDELVSSGQGLQWTHFDPKVLDTIRDLGSLDYTRARLARLSARELASVQNVPAYIFTLLSKRGKTAKQAAAAKGASVAALSALLDAALAPVHSPQGSSPGLYSHQASSLPRMNAMGSMNSLQLSPDSSHLQRSFTMGAPSVHQGSPVFTATGAPMGTLNDMLSHMPDMQYSGGGGGGYVRRPMQAMPTRSHSMQHDMLTTMPVSPLQQYNQLAAAQLAMLQQRQQHVASPPTSAFRVGSHQYFNSPSAYMN